MRAVALALVIIVVVAGCADRRASAEAPDGPDGTPDHDGGVLGGGGEITGGGSGGRGGEGGGGGVGATGGAEGGATGGPGGGVGSGGTAAEWPCRVPWGGDLQQGTPADDQLLGLTIDADDNIVASGYERGVVGVTNIEPDGDARAVVFQLSPAGATGWRAVLDTPGTDTAEDVSIDPTTGTLWVLGRTSGAFAPFVNQGQFDLVLASLDRTGQVLTLLQAGNERPQHPARLTVGPGGDIVAAGWDDTFVPTNYVAANQDGFIASFRIDATSDHGASQRSLQYVVPPAANAPYTQVTDAVAERDGSGAVYVTSHVATNRSGTQGTFVAKLRGDGSVDWNTNLSTFPFDAVTAAALSPSGHLVVTGGTFLTLGAQAFGQEDVFVAELDRTTGMVLWAAQAGGPDTDYPTDVTFDPNGAIVVTGITLGSVAAGIPNQGSFDIFAMRFTAAGQPLSVWQTGTSGDDQATGVAVDRCGRVFMGGYTRGALVPGASNAGGQDMFILRANLR